MTPKEAKKEWPDYCNVLIILPIVMAVTVVSLLVIVVVSLFDIPPRYPEFMPSYLVNICMFVGCILEVLLIIRHLKEGRRIQAFCEHCGKHIDRNMNWACGSCSAINPINFYWTSFLHKCERCGQSPHAIICPECDELNYLDDEKIARNPARKAHNDSNKKAPQIASPDETHIAAVTELGRKKDILLGTAAVVEAEANLERVRKALAVNVEKSLTEQLEKSYASFRERNLAVDTIATRELKHAEETYQDNSDMLERTRITIEAWREENIQ